MNRLKELRIEKKLRQKDVAEQIGVSTQSYNFYENWVNKPDPDTLIKLADLFEVSIDYLLGRTEDYGTIISKTATAHISATTKTQLGEISSIEEQLILDFRKLPAQTQDYVIGITRNLAAGN